MDRQRIAICLEYDGRAFHGWQAQRNASSVQQTLEQALHAIDGMQACCVAAGRTDAGVHAEAMLAHVDVDARRFARAPRAYVHGLNARLPNALRVLGARAVREDFHARFDCRERGYRYRIWNRSTASALHPWRHWWMPRPLDIAAMQQACTHFLGRRDFSAVRASGCQAASPVRTLRELRVEARDHEIDIFVAADAFLYHMVRNIVGCLVEVGLGNWSQQDLARILQRKSRQHRGCTAPAHGLYFTEARYDDFSSRDLRCG